MKIGDKEAIIYTLEKFQQSVLIEGIVLVRPKEDAVIYKQLLEKYNLTKVIGQADSGVLRQNSVMNGLELIPPCDVVLVHNGANVLVTDSDIGNCALAAGRYGAAAVALPVRDTTKSIDEGGFVTNTHDRSSLRAIQTPQGIQYDLMKEAFAAIKNGTEITDDVQAVELLGKPVIIIDSSSHNFKLTTPDDLIVAENILNLRKEKKFVEGLPRIGIGFCAHPIIKEKTYKKLVLGGLTLDKIGLVGNSDGDVIYHALCDALSMAAGGPTMSHYADPMVEKGITDSSKYLSAVRDFIYSEGYVIGNIVITLECLSPKISPIAEKIKENISSLLHIDKNKIGICGKTANGLSNYSLGLGIRADATVILAKIRE